MSAFVEGATHARYTRDGADDGEVKSAGRRYHRSARPFFGYSSSPVCSRARVSERSSCNLPGEPSFCERVYMRVKGGEKRATEKKTTVAPSRWLATISSCDDIICPRRCDLPRRSLNSEHLPSGRAATVRDRDLYCTMRRTRRYSSYFFLLQNTALLRFSYGEISL